MKIKIKNIIRMKNLIIEKKRNFKKMVKIKIWNIRIKGYFIERLTSHTIFDLISSHLLCTYKCKLNTIKSV